ncbi:Fic family protein [Candidatus Bandiella numerosa]|uniref:Fic family protein n=1 Tax=Candidatus Bandiella numerosa TaxID=2570586 RepID=UPI001F1E421D|nr:Fic family protein [Candidatus Bandiella numerosa]
MSFNPKFIISANLTQILMDIESSRQTVSLLPITLQMLKSLRESAKLVSTHYSTKIEGNRLTQEEVKEVISGSTFPNRKRDEKEVLNYYLAINYVDGLIKNEQGFLSEKNIRVIHGLVMEGKEKATPYRDGQNVITDSISKKIVYMPPEAKDVTQLMHELLDWIILQKEKGTLPVPIIAAIAHYQFATIHPYYDGNGRTARLLTNIILHKLGYGLKGIYSLEEYYAKNLQSYYDALSIGESHNYYFGRVEADISKWIEYFCSGMAEAFAKVKILAQEAKSDNEKDQSFLLRELDQRQKKVLQLFIGSKFITTKEIAILLGIHTRSALNLCKKWTDEGFILQEGFSNKTRKYQLVEKWLPLLQYNLN